MRFSVLLLIAALAACAGPTCDTKSQQDKIASYKEGVTVCHKIQDDLGTPNKVDYHDDGTSTLTYAERANNCAPLFDDYVMGGTSRRHETYFTCDAKGILTQVTAKNIVLHASSLMTVPPASR